MTDTIRVPRWLLAELQEHIHCHHDAVLWGKVCDLLAAAPEPSRELEVVATLLIDDPTGNECGDWDIDVESGVADRMSEMGGGDYELCRRADAQAVIDQLKADYVEIESALVTKNHEAHDLEIENRQLKADNETWKKLHDWLKAENEQLKRQLNEAVLRYANDARTRKASDATLEDYLAAGIAADNAELAELRTQLAEARELLTEVRTLECRGVDMAHIDAWLEKTK